MIAHRVDQGPRLLWREGLDLLRAVTRRVHQGRDVLRDELPLPGSIERARSRLNVFARSPRRAASGTSDRQPSRARLLGAGPVAHLMSPRVVGRRPVALRRRVFNR